MGKKKITKDLVFRISLNDFLLNQKISGHLATAITKYCHRRGLSSMVKSDWIKFYDEFMSCPPAVLDIRDAKKRAEKIARFMKLRKKK